MEVDELLQGQHPQCGCVKQYYIFIGIITKETQINVKLWYALRNYRTNKS